MTQYHFLDEAGDAGLGGEAGSSSYFALAMVQLVERRPLSELALVRQKFHFPATFEFWYHKTTLAHKTAFFEAIQQLPFRVRAAVVRKADLSERFTQMSGPDFMVELTTQLILRASPLDIGGDVLIIDGATPALRRALRIRLSQACRLMKRPRPFAKIVSGDSRREDELQLADMVVGAVTQFVAGTERRHYQTFADKVVDLWQMPPQ